MTYLANTSLPGHPGDPDDILTDELMSRLQLIVYSYICAPICVLGIAANILNIFVFFRLGLNDVINMSFMSLTVTDLFSLIPLLWLSICANPYFAASDIPFDAHEIRYLTGGWPHVMFTRVTCWNTAFIAFERCLCIVFPLRVKSMLPKSRTRWILVAIYVLNMATVAPVYYSNRFEWRYYPTRNATLLGMAHTEGGEDVDKVAFMIVNVSAWISFAIVIICSSVLIRQMRRSITWRDDNMTPSDQSAALSVRDRRVIRIVVVVSVIFIVLYTPNTVCMTAMIAVTDFSITGRHRKLFVVVYSFIFLMESINASVNIFVFYKMSSRYRAKFSEIFRICRRNNNHDLILRNSSSSN